MNIQQRLGVLAVLLVAQATVGYVQYFNDIPALLVGIHIAGATAVWSAVVCFQLGLFEAVEPTTNVPEAVRMSVPVGAAPGIPASSEGAM